MTVQVLINKISCAKEVYKIAIKRWRIAGAGKLVPSHAMGAGGEAGPSLTTMGCQ